VLPTLDPPLLCRRALSIQRTAGAFHRPVVMQLSPCLDIPISPGQLLAGRTTVDVFARFVDEILLAEPAVRLGEISGFGTSGVTPVASQARISSPLK
jgi:hypothetical protein